MNDVNSLSSLTPLPFTATIVNNDERKRAPAIKIQEAPNPPVIPFR